MSTSAASFFLNLHWYEATVSDASNEYLLRERTFSALWRLKTHLRATMSQQQLNDLLRLHIHKNETDSLDLVEFGA